MTKPIIRIHDIETDQIIEREMNEQEFAEHERKLVALVEQESAAATKAAEKAAVLKKLGLTADEVTALLS
jgi:hypothetical protein